MTTEQKIDVLRKETAEGGNTKERVADILLSMIADFSGVTPGTITSDDVENKSGVTAKNVTEALDWLKNNTGTEDNLFNF